MPVLVVGGSIVGLSQSLFLAHHGVSVCAIERHAGTSLHPRARGFHERTIELFRASGVAAQLDQLGGVAPRARALPTYLVAETLTGPITSQTPLAGPPRGEAFPPARFVYLGQDRLEPIVLAAAQAAGADVRFGHELVDLQPESSGVRAEVVRRESGERYVIRADYVIAADGARSELRRRLGVAQSGRGGMGHNVACLFEADLTALREERPFGLAQITHPDAAGIIAQTDVANRFIYSVNYDPAKEPAEAFTPERFRARLRIATGIAQLEPTLRGIFPWEVAERVVDRFSIGRTFFVGDAAHQMPPAGGFGANVGIQDAANLAWKLAFVLRGHASAALLESYHDERHPVAVETASHAAIMALRMSPAGREATRDNALPEPQCVMRAYRYGAKPTIPQTLSEAPMRGEVGARAPHIWLDADEQRSTLDLFDRTLVLISADPRWADAVSTAAVPITFAEVPQSADVYGLGAQGAALVRPDAIVTARWEHAPSDRGRALTVAVEQLLHAR